ncbi:50S ribosomal protein L23 [Candidatus Peregrinibacteria bacterium]|nr:50S ribosomal protein L23 [Candidatus Peregrinibacteria bacterium]
MNLSSVILGVIVTEKSQRLKDQHVHCLRVHPQATKVDILNALRTFFDVDVLKVRTAHVGGKVRVMGGGKVIHKRHSYKKVLVTLAPKSKPLDIAVARSS